ncbi:MAG: D-alanine--D-alanine ligase [candidate division Zixibacteria bacterium]|nr:D-alanine--D-alanine ligase [candidate division Zixibacteria bacterium]
MKVLLLAGGDSSERNVSLDSGAAVFKALKNLGHEVVALDPATNQSLLDKKGMEYIADKSAKQEVLFPEKTDNIPILSFKSQEWREVEVVFIGLHGGVGENGAIQNLLDLAGKKYTGSNMTTSAVAMNKAIAKRLFESADILTPDWELYRLKDIPVGNVLINDICNRFEFPIIVKPNDGGSTIGLSKVNKEAELLEALEKAAAESKEILVEHFIAGRELTVAVLDGRAFPVVEIKPKNELYDYEAKYTKGKSEYIAPAPIDEELSRKMRETARKVFDMVGASGAVRIDFILDKSGKYYCLEINTLPGMTSLSLVPMAAKCEGITFEQLIEMMLQSALKK